MLHETRSSVRVWCYSLPPSLLRRPSSAACSCSTLAQLLRNSCSCSTLAQHSRNSRATLAQLLLSCFIGSASARAAQIPSICPPRHLLSSQPQLRLGMSSPVTAARLRSCLPPSANAARPTRRPPRRARCRSPCRSPPAGYSRGNQTQNPVGKIKKVVVIQLAVL